MEPDRNGLEVLDQADCLHLLQGQAFGRVAITSGALPVVLPVNYRLIDERVVFSTAPGAKLTAATTHTVVAFEIDHFDLLTHTGWSVLVTAVAQPVTDPAEAAALWAAGVPRWLSGPGARLVTLDTTRTTGRRLTHHTTRHSTKPATNCTTMAP